MNVQSWTVEQVMTNRQRLVVAWADTPFKQLVELMRARDVSALPVVDTDDHVLGVVSEADLLLLPRGARTAGELMTSPALTIGAGASVTEAAHVMHERRVKRLPVVDAEDRLAGIVSRRDLLGVFARADKDIAEEIEHDLRKLLWIGPPDVELTVARGIAWLRGSVETRSLAELAGHLAGAISGVIDVRNDLAWSRDDRDIHVDAPPLATAFAAAERGSLGGSR